MTKGNSLRNICYFLNLPIPTEELLLRGSSVLSDTFKQINQTVVNYSWNIFKGVSPLTCEISLKNLKFKNVKWTKFQKLSETHLLIMFYSLVPHPAISILRDRFLKIWKKWNFYIFFPSKKIIIDSVWLYMSLVRTWNPAATVYGIVLIVIPPPPLDWYEGRNTNTDLR
jgi:hypothetical protein